MLKNDFFYIESLSDDQALISATIGFNPSHKIFDGHFPGQPVVPGICMMQVIKEIAETARGRSLFLHKADIIKFLSVIVPQKDIAIMAEIKYFYKGEEVLNFEARLFRNDIIYLKFKGEFKQI